MTTQIAHVNYPLSMLTDDQVGGFFSVSSILWPQYAEALAVCSSEILRQEAMRRHAKRESGSTDAPTDGFAVDFALWSDKDLGDGLAVLTETSYTINNPGFGEYVDEWNKALSTAVVNRLRTSGDTRNATAFLDRGGPSDGNPEAN